MSDPVPITDAEPRARLHEGKYAFGGYYPSEAEFRDAATRAFRLAEQQDGVQLTPFAVSSNTWRGKIYFSATAEPAA